MSGVGQLNECIAGMKYHHEKWSGGGYPDGLEGEAIPMQARIVAIADAYDAMINDRPYKRAISHEQAIAELRRHSGTQFDPELVELFCDLYADRAPEPDGTILAMTAARKAHRAGPLVIPDASGTRATRKRRGAAGDSEASATATAPVVESQTSMASSDTSPCTPAISVRYMTWMFGRDATWSIR